MSDLFHYFGLCFNYACGFNYQVDNDDVKSSYLVLCSLKVLSEF